MKEPAVADALEQVAELGAFFAPTDLTPWTDGWRPARELMSDHAAVRRRVTFIQKYLEAGVDGPVEPRAAASLDVLGVAARLMSPAFATAAVFGLVPALDLDTVWWRDAAEPFRLGVPDRGALRAVVVTSAQTASEVFIEQIVTPLALPAIGLYGSSFGLSPQLLRGNLASALAGAASMIVASGTSVRISPVDIVAELMTAGPLVKAGTYETPFHEHPSTSFFVRNSCCLFYRVPGGGKCGDCVQLEDSQRRRNWREAIRQQSVRGLPIWCRSGTCRRRS